jgi:3',5'-cyclic AMP phosphodiesterase CpdA
MMPFTIAHLSDLHLSSQHRRSNIRRTRQVLDYIKSLNVDHIIITGDITANGDPGDYRIARSLFASSGLLDSRKLSLVIGNHDVFGGVHTAEEVLTFPGHCRTTDHKLKRKAFGEAFHETFEHTMRPSNKKLFPYAKVLGDLVIVGVNTVAGYSKLKNPFGSNGEVDDESYDRLVELLTSPILAAKRKIVALHHHFSKIGEPGTGTMHSVWAAIEKQTMKLRGKSRLIKLFAQSGVELVLHGHVHESHEYTRGGVRFLNAGGSILHMRNDDLHINVIKLTEQGCFSDIHRLAPQPAVTSLPAARPGIPAEIQSHQEAA